MASCLDARQTGVDPFLSTAVSSHRGLGPADPILDSLWDWLS